ncbi:MAG TPA: amylo-alpha-1,6-glucosidase [Acidobacteriota bacterium]
MKKRLWLYLILGFLAARSWALEGLIPRFAFEPCDIGFKRPARPSSYFDKAGRKFAILGWESGCFEAWAYPLKILRNFEFSFLLGTSSQPIRSRDIVRAVEVTPAVTTLTFVYQSFTVRASFLTPVDEPGAVILLAVDTTEPLTVICGLLPVLQPMWPAGLGGQYAAWDKELGAYLISEPTRKNHGLVGSPAAEAVSYTPAHMLTDTPNEFKIVVADPKETEGKFIPIILAGGRGDRQAVKDIYRRLAADPESYCRKTESHYRRLRESLPQIRTPEKTLNLALEWAKVAFDNLLVDNPDLGLGMVAGLGLSGTSGRPGFGWFFGGDAFLNSFSLSGLGAFSTVRDVLAFNRRWQREDGKMAHELSQSAGLIPWFKDYPYGYIHADTTPLYIVAVYDYWKLSGDAAFVREAWPSLVKAFDWCLAMDEDGLMDNRRAGLGALEFGSLTDIQTDIFLAAAWSRAAQAMEKLAAAAGNQNYAERARTATAKAVVSFRTKFWDEERGFYCYAFNAEGRRVLEPTPWSAFGLLWGLGEEAKTQKTLARLNRSDMMTDWGVRMMSSASSYYEPLNYNYGAVWPFLTGWVAAALFRNDFNLSGYTALMANVQHAFDNALGEVTELFSGHQNIWPAEAVAHQGFSTGGVVLPLVKGLLGLDGDASAKVISFEPRFPAWWPSASVQGVRLAEASFDLHYLRKDVGLRVEVRSREAKGWTMELSPVFGPAVQIRRARLNGKDISFREVRTERAVKPVVRFALSGEDRVDFVLKPAVEVVPPYMFSETGDLSRGLRIIDLTGDEHRLHLLLEGLAGESYYLSLQNSHLVDSVKGAVLENGRLKIAFPAAAKPGYVEQKVVLLGR